MIRKRRKALRRKPQSMMNNETTIWRASWWPENAKVMIARTMKLVPPAKSVGFF